MFNAIASAGFRRFGGVPAFRIWGKGRPEPDWRVIDVYATRRRDLGSRWPHPLWPGVCITWTASVVAVGWDFAASVYREQTADPASRDRPVTLDAGRLRSPGHFPSASEVMAHEVGHTWQARRLSAGYWPVGAAFTLWREGPHWWNWFENQASAVGQFGGLVNGSVSGELLRRVAG